MKQKDVETFEKINTQLDGIYQEITALSKKSPNDGINTFKLKFVNKVLSDANSFLKEKYRPFDDFEVFNEDEIPTNSDVAFVLSQYLNCLELFRSDNIIHDLVGDIFGWWWVVDGKTTSLRTAPPKKIKESK